MEVWRSEIVSGLWGHLILDVCVDTIVHPHTHYPSLVMSQNTEVILVVGSFVEKKKSNARCLLEPLCVSVCMFYVCMDTCLECLYVIFIIMSSPNSKIYDLNIMSLSVRLMCNF